MSLAIRRRGRPQINIVPLIDVLTILIFFFLLTMQFSQLSALNITPPKIETAGKTAAQHTLSLAVSSEGQFSLDGEIIEAAALRTTLEDRAKTSGVEEVLLVVDEATPVKYLTQAMDTCSQAGLAKVKLQSRN